MEENFTTIILAISFINIFILFLTLREYLLYKKEQQEHLFKLKIKEVKENERKQLVHYVSSELHDNISQMVSLAIMNTGVIETSFNNKKQVENIRELLDKTLVSVRHLIKTVQLEEAVIVDLEHHLEELLTMLNQSSSVMFSISGKIPQLDNERNYLLFRILQEITSNIIKHSNVQQVQINFEKTGFFSLIKIQHNGRSFSPEKEDFQKGYGLNNIYENAKLLKATLQFSQENEKVLIKLPIEKN